MYFGGLLWELNKIVNLKAPDSQKRALYLEQFFLNTSFPSNSSWTDISKTQQSELLKNTSDVWKCLIILYTGDKECAHGTGLWASARAAPARAESVWQGSPIKSTGALAPGNLALKFSPPPTTYVTSGFELSVSQLSLM